MGHAIPRYARSDKKEEGFMPVPFSPAFLSKASQYASLRAPQGIVHDRHGNGASEPRYTERPCLKP